MHIKVDLDTTLKTFKDGGKFKYPMLSPNRHVPKSILIYAV